MLTHQDFSELAVLAAIEMIDERDIILVEEYAENSPELANELAELRLAVNSLPYANEPLPLPTNLKTRLFERLAAEDTTENSKVLSSEMQSFVVKASEYNWQPHPLVSGISIVNLYTDLVHRQMACLVRCEAGAIYPSHKHANFEEIFMLEGDLISNNEIYGKGDYLYSAFGSIHHTASREGCLFFVRTSLDDAFVS